MTFFEKEAQSSFSHIANAYGMVLSLSSGRTVRYQNGEVFLQIRFDAGRSFEVGVEVGKVAHDCSIERPFSLPEVLRSSGIKEPSWIDGAQAASDDELVSVIRELSLLTETHAGRFLEGSVDAFNQLASFRDKECAEYASERDLRFAKIDAEKAWNSKDYLAVVDIYEKHRNQLGATEMARLSYAMKQCRKSS